MKRWPNPLLFWPNPLLTLAALIAKILLESLRGCEKIDNSDTTEVREWLEHIKYYYTHKDLFPRMFETFSNPIAIYDRDGVITGANKMFRTFAGIDEDDILIKNVNIFTCLNDKKKGLIESLHIAFNGEEKVCENVNPALNTKDIVSEYQINFFRNAIFFPMIYSGGKVKLAGLLLDKREPFKQEEETEYTAVGSKD